MAQHTEVYDKLELDGSNTVGDLFGAVTRHANASIDGITEPMRKKVFRVRSILRGDMDIIRTTVRIGGMRGLPVTQTTLLTRWANLGKERFGGNAGQIEHTQEVIAGGARLRHMYDSDDAPIVAGSLDDRRLPHSADFVRSMPLDGLEPGRQAILLSAAQTLLAHAAAVEEINGGGDPALALALLRNPVAYLSVGSN